MTKYALLMISAFALSASPLMAQSTTQSQIDCEDEANKDDDGCLMMYLPTSADLNGAAPLVGLSAIAIALLASGGGSSTSSTTSTTSTAN